MFLFVGMHFQEEGKNSLRTITSEKLHHTHEYKLFFADLQKISKKDSFQFSQGSNVRAPAVVFLPAVVTQDPE